MVKKLSIIHAGWAIAVIGAFALGSSRSASPDGGESGGNTERTRAAGSISALADSDGNATKAGERNASEPSGGRIGSLFGVSTASAAGLEALATQAIRDPNPITRRLAFSRLLEAMTPENAAEIRGQLVALGADGDQWRDFHYSWGAIAGMEAFTHAGDSPERDLAATLTGWAAANPAEALSLLDNLPEEMRGQRDQLAESVVAGLADSDRSLATDLVLRLAAEGNERAGNLMEIVAGETLRAEGPEAAAKWSELLPDGPLKGAAMSRIAGDFARSDPEAAALWAQRFADQDFASRTIEQVGGRWAQSNPVAAVGWLETLPAGGGQSSGLNAAFGDWEDRDPIAAGQYLLNMPRSEQRDAAISGFASGYAWQDPQTAIAWANDIGDPSLRERSLTRVGRAYFRRDPDSARTWLESSGLPQEARQEILNSRR